MKIRSSNVKKLTVIAILVMSLPSIVLAQVGDYPKTDAEIKAKCEIEMAQTCHGACFDGFGTTCYYDNSKHLTPPEFWKDKSSCFGYRHLSVCEPCANVFQIIRDKKIQDVLCVDFYQQLRSYDKSCSGCLKANGRYGG